MGSQSVVGIDFAGERGAVAGIGDDFAVVGVAGAGFAVAH